LKPNINLTYKDPFSRIPWIFFYLYRHTKNSGYIFYWIESKWYYDAVQNQHKT